MMIIPENLRKKIDEQSPKNSLYLTGTDLSYKELKGGFDFNERCHVKSRHLP